MPANEWLSVMPAIPLARAVPVLWLPEPTRALVLEVDEADGTAWAQWATPAGRLATGGGWASLDALRVDLDDPQGFAYALRLLCQPRPASVHYDLEWAQRIDRHLCGETTPEDRFALATALRAAVSP